MRRCRRNGPITLPTTSSLAASPHAFPSSSRPATRPATLASTTNSWPNCALPHFHLDDVVEERALAAQAQLARVGHHRLPPVDLIIAALADRHELGVLHCDHDYDLIADKTDLAFDSVWFTDRGTL